jgi:hypothetical protein
MPRSFCQSPATHREEPHHCVCEQGPMKRGAGKTLAEAESRRKPIKIMETLPLGAVESLLTRDDGHSSAGAK